MHLDVVERTLRPKRAFTLSREKISERRSVFVTLEQGGLVGRGEGSPIARYGQTAEACLAALEALRDVLADADPSASTYAPLIQSLQSQAPEARPALAALDAAIMDWVGKSEGMPLCRLHGIDPSAMPPTSMTIAIDRPDQVRELARQARDFSILKLKLGGEQDRSMVEAIRDVTDVPIRGDANEGYAGRETAIREIAWLASQNVELIEQPLPADRPEDMAWLKERSPLPLIADEGFSDPKDLPDLKDAYHGINIKLVKSGGTLAALQAIKEARRQGLRVMLGSTLESSLGIAAAAHLAPLADHVDLDGNLLLANDPFHGHPVENGRIVLSDRPGLGIIDPLDG